jgi:glycosyltransferase involved in cell wall biosynthesis
MSNKISHLDLLAVIRFVRVVQAHKGDDIVVHAHGIRAAWIACWARRFVKFHLVSTLHNIPPAKFTARIAIGEIQKRSDRVIAVSDAIAERIPIRPAVISNGVDLPRYSNLNRNDARKRLNIPLEKFVVGCIARLAPEKGVDILLKAAKIAHDPFYLIAGEGVKKSELEADAPENTHFVGYQQNTLDILAASDIIAIPSRSEGQSIVALEAFASERAVVASEVGGLARLVQNGKNGIVFPVEDSKALASSILWLEKSPDLRSEFTANGLRFVQKNADINKIIKQVENIYDTVSAD